MTAADRYAFRPGVDVRVRGAADVRRHFRAEYGDGATADGGAAAAVEVSFGRARANAACAISGGHKTVRWRVAVGDPDSGALSARIELGGAPRSFALSLVQGYFVEPLLAVAAARSGYVLLPAAAIAQGPAALVMLGASGTGKSSLSVRALAAGSGVLGDDQILIDPNANCFRFHRRMRFYPDLRLTAPAAWQRLPPRARNGLRARSVARALSRGHVAPSLPLRPAALGDPGGAGPLPACRFVLIERAARVRELGREPLAPHDATAYALELLAAQRERFAAGLGERWDIALAALAAVEAEILASAFARAPIERLSLPAAWRAPQAIAALAGELGTERQTAA